MLGGTSRYQPTSASAAAWRGFILLFLEAGRPPRCSPLRIDRLRETWFRPLRLRYDSHQRWRAGSRFCIRIPSYPALVPIRGAVSESHSGKMRSWRSLGILGQSLSDIPSAASSDTSPEARARLRGGSSFYFSLRTFHSLMTQLPTIKVKTL